MCEKHLEELIATYPDEFFPDRGFRLVSRQAPLRGVGRFDLLFLDNRQRYWLIEMKAVPLKITDTDQVMGYYERLRQQSTGEAYIPCFVAPSIPLAVRNYLDGKGIDHREFTLAEFRRIVQEQGVQVECELLGVTRPEGLGPAVSVRNSIPSQRKDRAGRGNQPSTTGDNVPTLVTSVDQVIKNIRIFQNAVSASGRSTPAGVHHWYYLPDEDIAGPSRFIGYQNMTAEKYDVARGEHSVDGRETEQALKRLHAFIEVYPSDDLYDKAYAAAERLLPEGKRLNQKARLHVLLR